MNFKDNMIIVTNDKKSLLEELNKTDKLFNIKIISLKELIDNFTYYYDEKALYFLVSKYNVKPSIAKEYLENLKYIDKDYQEEKLIFLKNIKEELEKEKLTIRNELFKEEIKDKDIVIYNIPYLKKYELKIIDEIKKITNVNIYNKDKKTYKHKIYKLNSIKEEVIFIANEICKLINKGIPINNIKLMNVKKEYYNEIKRVFKNYNIPVELNDNTSIYGTEIVKEFLEKYETSFEEACSFIIEKYKDNDIVNKIINICNKYYFINDSYKKDLIIEDIKNTNIDNVKYVKSVKEIKLSSIVSDEDYVFLLCFNEGIIPLIKKDEEYLTDKEKSILKIETTSELNKKEKEQEVEQINSIKNLYITYKTNYKKEKFYVSTLINDIDVEHEEYINEDISYSKINDEMLLTEYLDNYIKYGMKDNNLEMYFNTYKNMPYGTYDNKYKGIDKDKLIKYLKNELTLSYSALDNYHKCGFKYYLSNILKLNDYTKTYFQFIGSLFHYVLENYYKDNIDVEEYIDKYIKENEITLDSKEEFFLQKLKKELYFVIETINEQMKYSEFDNILTEEKIVIEKEYKDVKITFKGFIDKVLYKKYKEKTLVALIDYKTGEQKLDLSLMKYGLNMQLPIYLYLAENSKLENILFVGFYIQRIINKEIVFDKNKTYDMQHKELLKLQGYSNNSFPLIEKFDKSYKNSNVIKGLKITNKGVFDARSKVITNEEINDLINSVKENINNSCKNILDANFDINPKIIKNKNISCEYCDFKDICFVKEKDKITLDKD